MNDELIESLKTQLKEALEENKKLKLELLLDEDIITGLKAEIRKLNGEL